MKHIIFLLLILFIMNGGTRPSSERYDLLENENARLHRAVDSINVFSALDMIELRRSTGAVKNCPSVAQIAFFDSLVVETRAHKFTLDTLNLKLNECRE